MLTGKSPAVLGIYYFLKPDNNYNLNVSPVAWKKWNPIWDQFSNADKSVCVFNIPTTIAYDVNGKFISGPIWGEDASSLAYPKELNAKLNREKYTVRPATNIKISGEDVFIKEIYRNTQTKFELFFNFFVNEDWDLFVMSFNSTDTFQHYFWKYRDPEHLKYSKNSKYKNIISNFYQVIDEYLGEFLNNLPKNTTLIMTSDHGHKVAHTYVNLNALLAQKGYLKIKNEILNSRQNSTKKYLKKATLSGLYGLTRSYSKLIYDTKMINKKFFRKLQQRMKVWLYLIENKNQIRYKVKDYIDWENTVAYSPTLNTIYLNVQGRQVKGKVSKKDYIKVRDKIIKDMIEIEDPRTGKKIFDHIMVKEEVYPKNPPEDFPDLYVHLNKGYINYYSELHHPNEPFSTDVHFSTEHSLDGIFVAFGPELKKGETVENVRLEDIVPTALHIYGLPIPKNIDGRVVKEIFASGTVAATRTIKQIGLDEIKKAKKSSLRSIKFSKKI
jgi:predicted AlkP superfamily phosphohydrolase/phosphomutase